MAIFINQAGYQPLAKKIAVMTSAGSFQVMRKQGEKDYSVYDGQAQKQGLDEASKDMVYTADFSDVKEEGQYYIKAEDGSVSYTFAIGKHVYKNVHKDLLKALYYQRCGCELKEQYAGVYKHDCCHQDKALLFEQQDISKNVTGGWHDAGDYGRYISPAAVAVGHLLYAYELFPDSFQMELAIPESKNAIPDVLNECRYELEWMLKMQDEEGGAYHKLTAMRHAPFIMPEEDKDQFYLFPVSSMATADYAAVMALAYRIYKDVDERFAGQLLDAAKRAWGWLKVHPEYIGFYNPDGCNTGEYDDDCDLDERMWAAAEMRLVLQDASCEAELIRLLKEDVSATDFGWTDVSGFASLCVLTNKDKYAEEIVSEFQKKVLLEADRLVEVSKKSGYGVAMEAEDYVWGSNMVVANRGILLILADYIKKQEDTAQTVYHDVVYNQLHYLLGKNALGYSYITGHGEHAFLYPHNRPTVADGIEAPMSGFVSGGPFKTPCDIAAKELLPEGTPPMKCYIDDWRSYSTNEITIYWNTAVIFLTAYLNI